MTKPKIEESITDWKNDPSGANRVVIRPEVAEFAIEMEKVLRENDYKKGWDKLTIDDLFFRIKDEYEELEQAYDLYANPLIGIDEVRDEMHNMRREAIDIANFCMFLCHNYPKTEAQTNG
jgi:hypothetical protein